jgi:Protein of unknown function (DUF3631).
MTMLDDLDVTIDGAKLLNELHAAVLRYVVMPSPEAADALVLWIAATHGQDAWEHAPRCAVCSPEKRCGKSRLMDIAEATCRRSLVTVNISPAALVREVTDEDPPTLFIDEADTIFGPKSADNNEDLRGIVNSGHQRGRPYTRYDITSRKNEHLPTFAMAMLAGIGELPDTIMDRAIVIRMRRRAAGEQVAPYRTRRDRPALHELRERLSKWVQANIKELTSAIPTMPVEDRAADTWEPLFAIADLAGGRWPARAKKAALVMVAAENEADTAGSEGVRLLGDIKAIFETMPHVGFLPSAEVVNLLLKIDDAPWKEIGRDGLSARGLALKLRPYGIQSGHNAAKTARGYHLADFGDAFARYLSSTSVQASRTASDQGKRPDTYEDSSVRASVRTESRTHTSVPTDSSVRTESPGQATFTDAWTDADGSTCEVCGFPYDSNGHADYCGRAA